MKNWSIDYRLLLTFIGLAEKQVNVSDLATLAKFVGVTDNEVTIALVKLTREKMLTIAPDITKPFEFTVDKEVRSGLLHEASSFRAHREAYLGRAERVAKYSDRGKGARPSYLVEITKEMREPHMLEAEAMSKRIAHPEFAKKMGNCLVRLGVAEIEPMVVEAEKLTEGRLRCFLKRYTKRRDELFKPK